MNREYSDIETVRKYFNGGLSKAEMHDLEARALDDPFLKDAMDGFEDFPIEQNDINDLERRLALRTAKKDKGSAIWGLKQWGIAASIIFGIALISIYFNQTPENKVIALSELQKSGNIPVPIVKEEMSIEDSLFKEDQKEESLATIVNENPSIVSNQKKNSTNQVLRSYTPADEIVVETMANSDKMDSDEVNERILEEKSNQAKKEKAIDGAVAGLKVEQMAALSKSRMSLVASSNVKSTVLKGRITDVNNNEALPGVSITDTETGITTQTDVNGVFKIPVNQGADLKVSYIGFETQTLSAKTKDSINILLKPNQSSLSEVVVTGYGTTKKTSEETLAGPNGGWKAFRKYLDENAKLPNHSRARVNIEFVITNDGALTNFKVVKSYNKMADDKAIKLIKNYIGWHGSTVGLPQKIKVTVRFK